MKSQQECTRLADQRLQEIPFIELITPNIALRISHRLIDAINAVYDFGFYAPRQIAHCVLTCLQRNPHFCELDIGQSEILLQGLTIHVLIDNGELSADSVEFFPY